MKLHIILTALFISCMSINAMDQNPQESPCRLVLPTENNELCEQTLQRHRTIVEKTDSSFGIPYACEQAKKSREQAHRDGRNTCIAYALDTAIIGVLVAVIYYNR